jgi:CheY-like chemotaxis protein
MNGGRSRKENMRPVYPSLDLSQNSVADARELAMLRHDIKGALHGVLGGLSQIEASALADPVREQLDRATVSARTLARLLNTLLAEAPAPAGDPADVGRLLSRMRARHAAEAREQGLGFVVDAGEGVPPALRLDRVSLVRVLDNLVGNALMYAGSGSTVRLAAACEPTGEVVFRVTDEGSGPGRPVPERPLPAASGQGLGLQIARTLVEALGGSLTLGDRQEGGLEAVVRFPAAVGEAAPPAAERPDLSGMRILLAEDNPTNQMVASQMLRSLNAEVVVCSDGIEALERFEQDQVDLIVVDIEMPRMSGLDVIRTIRAREDARAQVPIVALTAYAMREHRERITAAGANGLISKPVTSIEALGRALAAHAGSARAPVPEALRDDREPEGVVIDQATYAALCEAIGPELIVELLDKVIADLLGAQRDLAAALGTLDGGAIRAATHILISVAGALGAVRLQGCARALNGTAHGEAREALAAGVRRCMAEIDLAVAFARERLAASREVRG